MRVFGKTMSSYEKEEVVGFQNVYFLNMNAKNKANYNTTSSMENNQEDVFNFGFDTEDGDFLYEAGDHINYRYEVIKRLGRGAFGVVIRCFDHKTKQ